MAAATKKEKKRDAYFWTVSGSSRYTANLKQFILETFDIYKESPKLF
jgi:hypothetical protein